MIRLNSSLSPQPTPTHLNHLIWAWLYSWPLTQSELRAPLNSKPLRTEFVLKCVSLVSNRSNTLRVYLPIIA
jgi:hypothetical protein